MWECRARPYIWCPKVANFLVAGKWVCLFRGTPGRVVFILVSHSTSPKKRSLRERDTQMEVTLGHEASNPHAFRQRLGDSDSDHSEGDLPFGA